MPPPAAAGAVAAPAGRLPGSRALLWAQLLVGWVPVWALFTTLIVGAHPGASLLGAAVIALRMVLAAAALAVLVHRVVARLPWPQPSSSVQVRSRFVGVHLLAAAAFAVVWVGVNVAADRLTAVALLAEGRVRVHYPLVPYLVLGVWLYVMIAGVAYAHQATARAARAEAMAAQAQLAALRAQLHPHFLFNALHAVVHLIPREPRRAAQAAEQLGELLRATVDQEHDAVPLAAELAFVERYLDLERLRFGDRLRVELAVEPAAERALVPAFAVLTLVENAVRHGAAPRVEPTTVTVQARHRGGALELTVADDGAGASSEQLAGRQGSGLRRLRERLAVLHGDRARLELASDAGGFTARLLLPAALADEDADARPAAGAPDDGAAATAAARSGR